MAKYHVPITVTTYFNLYFCLILVCRVIFKCKVSGESDWQVSPAKGDECRGDRPTNMFHLGGLQVIRPGLDS